MYVKFKQALKGFKSLKNISSSILIGITSFVNLNLFSKIFSDSFMMIGLYSVFENNRFHFSAS